MFDCGVLYENFIERRIFLALFLKPSNNLYKRLGIFNQSRYFHVRYRSQESLMVLACGRWSLRQGVREIFAGRWA
jgi:hypothetical protein